jgi:hypothetical protein
MSKSGAVASQSRAREGATTTGSASQAKYVVVWAGDGHGDGGQKAGVATQRLRIVRWGRLP